MSDTYKHISFHTKHLESFTNHKINNLRHLSLPIRSVKQIPILNAGIRLQCSNTSQNSNRVNDKCKNEQSISSNMSNSNLMYMPVPSLNTTRLSFNQVDWNSLIGTKSRQNAPKRGQNQIIYEKLFKQSNHSGQKKSYVKPNTSKDSQTNSNTNSKDKEYCKWNMMHKAYCTVNQKSNYNIFFERKDALAKEMISSSQPSKLQFAHATDFRKISEADEKQSHYQKSISTNCNKEELSTPICLDPILNKSTNFFSSQRKDFWSRIGNIPKDTYDNQTGSSFTENKTKTLKFLANETSKLFSGKLIESPKGNEKQSTNDQKSPVMDEIFQRILDRNKKEAEARNNGLFLNSSQFHERICSKRSTSQKFYKETKEKYFQKEKNGACIDIKGNLELFLDSNEVEHWQRHEETWNLVLETIIADSNLKFLVPPNEKDILLSAYYFTHNGNNSRITINCSKPDDEIKRWKALYKKLMARWHPDKMYPLLEKLNLEEDMVNKIKRKSFSIIDNISNYFAYIIKKIKSMA